MIKSEDENQFFYDLLRNTIGTPSGWIGLYRRADKKLYWLDGRPEEGNYHKWYDGEPNNFGGAEDCAYVQGGNHGGKWNDGTCLATDRVAICQYAI